MKKIIASIFYKVDRKLEIVMAVLFVLGVVANMVSGSSIYGAIAKSTLFVLLFYAVFALAFLAVIFTFKHDELNQNK